MDENEPKCARCGMRQADWSASEGKGITKGGQQFCCEGCAGGGSCVCSTKTVR